MADGSPVLSNTLGETLQLHLILGSINQLLHELDTPFSSIIDSQELHDKVPGLNICGETAPQADRSFQPGEIFYLQQVKQ